MPAIYPHLHTSRKINYEKNNVSRVPLRITEDPKEFLYSKHYYETRYNKVMNIPVLIKEQPLKASSEKQSYWNLSDTRRRQLEDSRQKEVLLAKKNRLVFYINHKFVSKFGSRHKSSIAAVVENFLVRKEAANIDSEDLCELDKLISDLIARKKEKAVASSNIFSNTNYSKDSSSQKFLSSSLGQLPKEKEKVFTPLQFHRSLTIEERLKSEILFKKTSSLKQKNFLEDQIREEKERQKLKERENYKYRQYIDKNFEVYNLEEIQKQKDARFKQSENKRYYDAQIREKNVQLQREREAAIMEEEKNALIIEENHIDQQRRAFQAKQRALIYKEKVQTERNTLQNDLNTSHTNNRFRSSSHNDKFRSSIKADENFIYNNVLKTENKGLDSRKHTAEFKTENKGSDSRRNTADRHTADIHKNNGGVMNFKLSQKTFKKIVLDKQHEQKILNLQIEGRNAALKKNEFNNSDLLSIDSNILHTKGSQKILNDLSLSGQNKINKGFFVNRDIEKFSQSSRSAILK